MPLIAFFIEIVLPLVLIYVLLSPFFKHKKNSKLSKARAAWIERWGEQKDQKAKTSSKRDAQKSKPVVWSEVVRDWDQFYQLFGGDLPKSSQKDFEVILKILTDLSPKLSSDHTHDQSHDSQLTTHSNTTLDLLQSAEVRSILDIVYCDAPEMTLTFIEMPEAMREGSTMGPTGKNAHQLFCENTQILKNKAEEISHALFFDNLKSLAVNQAYFKKKFND